MHAIVKFNNGLTKFLVHDTNMTIPIFNTLYYESNNMIKSHPLNIKILNNLEFENVDNKRFPVINLINELTDKDSLFETVIVSANDILVNKFLKNEIKFIDISKKLLKITSLNEFKRFKQIKPKNIKEIEELADYVSFKISTMSI